MLEILKWVKLIDGYVARWELDTSPLFKHVLRQLSTFVKNVSEYEDFDPESPTKFWLEVAHHFIKLLAERALRAEGSWSSEVSNVLMLKNAPEFKQADAMGATPNVKAAAAEAKKIFREIYG